MMKTRPQQHSPLLNGIGALALLALVACQNEIGSDDPGAQGGMSSGAQPGAGGPPVSSSGRGGNGNGTGGSIGPGGQNGAAGSNSPRGGSSSSSGGTTGSSGASGTAGAGGTNQPPPDTLTDCTTPGPRMVRRLTAAQYRNTLLEIFGQDQSVPSEDVLIDPQVNGFHADADAPLVQDLDAELLMNYAETVAAWAVEGGKLSTYYACMNQDDNCRREFIRKFGQRVHREALPEDRITAYMSLMAAEATFQAGVQVAVTAMLQSPYLLYRRELGQSDPASANTYKLTPHEIASELAYFLTDSAPDQALLDAASQNRLQTATDIERELNRLVNSDKGRRALAKFVKGWVGIDGLPLKAKDEKQLPFPEALRTAMLRETEEFFFDAFFSNKSVSDLFAAKHTFVNQELAAVYQLGGASSNFQRVDLTGSKRAPGILGHGAFLTAHAQPENSSPVQRGVTIRERILCQDLPPVPQNLDTNLASGASFTTNRERYREHSANDACVGCHQSIDPVGFAFEHYDAFGRYREQENGKPIDATGTLAGVPEGNIPLDGAESLINYLSKSEAVRSCLVRYWSYYAYGRDQWAEKQCNHDAIRREAGKQNYSLKGILTGISRAPHFVRRVKDQ